MPCFAKARENVDSVCALRQCDRERCDTLFTIYISPQTLDATKSIKVGGSIPAFTAPGGHAGTLPYSLAPMSQNSRDYSGPR